MSTREPDARTISREARKASTRQRLIDAALELCERDGYAATSVEQITAHAGLGRATFYLHFARKGELARALLRDIEAPSRRVYDALAAVDRSDRVAFEHWLEFALTFWDEHRPAIKLIDEALAVEQDLDATMYATLEHTVAALMEAIGDTTALGHARSALLVVGLERAAYFAKIRGWDVDHELLRTALADIWLSPAAAG